MKITISNIAWNVPAEDEHVAALLQEFGVQGVDIALSKVWADPLAATDEEILAYRGWWEERGIQIAGAQSLHFGHPEFQLFGSAQERQAMHDFTARMIELCGKLGITAIVFGSPKNRVRGDMPMEQAMDIATEFFRSLGEVAAANNTCLCIEPNASDYGCDFVTTSSEGLELVKRVDNAGFRLHLDSGNMTMMKEDCAAAIENCIDYMQHFHVSEPQLDPVGAGESPVPHADIAATLKRVGYDKWVSVEMRDSGTDDNREAVKKALTLVKSVYS